MTAPLATRLGVRALALSLVVMTVTLAAWLRMRGAEMPATSAVLIAVLALAAALGGLRVGLLGALVVGAWILLARSVPGSPFFYLPDTRLTVGAELAALVIAMTAGAVTHRRAAWLRREWWHATDRADATNSRIRALRAVTDPGLAILSFDELLRELLSRIRKHLAADYATVLEITADGTALRPCASDGLDQDAAQQVCVPTGEGLSGRVAQTREAAAADDLDTAPEARSALRDHFKSVAAAPLLVEGRVFGVLEIGTRASRHFTEDDIRLLQLVADRVATAIAQARLLDAERAARGAAVDAQHRYRGLVEGIDAIVWEADATTLAFTFVNSRAETLLGWPPDVWRAPDAYVTRIVHPDDRTQVRDHLERVAAAGGHAESEYRVLASDGRVTWVREMVYVARDGDGAAPQLRGVLVDIGMRKRAERRLAAQFGVTQALAESNGMSDAAPRILRGICEHLGWDLGLYWAVDPTTEVLRCVNIHSSLHDEGAFETESRAMTFERGVGIPGRTWAAAAPLWIPDVLEVPQLRRADLMVQRGLHAALAFPLIDATGVVGVMEFLSTEIRYPDADLLQMAEAAGSQMGQFLERRRAEAAVRESEARTRAVIDSALECVISIDASGRITEWNPAAESTFGWTREQAVGQEMAALIVPPSLRGAHRAGLQRYLDTGEARVLGRRLELRALRADGTEFPVELTITRVPVAGPPTFTGYVRDISDRKRAEESQRVLNEASRVLVSTLDGDEALGALTRIVVPALADWCVVDMIDDGDPDHMRRVAVAHSNPAKADRVRDLSAHHPIALASPSGPGHVAATGVPELVPLVSPEMRDREGESSGEGMGGMGPVSYVSVPIEARHRRLGVLTLVSAESRRRYGPEELALAQDIAHRAAMAVDNARLYEDALVASRAKSDFLAVMSHELRTPLNAVIGYAELLLMGVPTPIPSQTHGHVERIRTASRHLLEIVEEILTFSRMEAGREAVVRAPADAVALVRDTIALIEPMAREKGLDFVTRVPNHAIAMETDAGKVRQILLNLLSNAVKFTEQGHVALTLAERDGGIVVVVEDTGIGISEDNADRVFEPFWQVQQSATRQAGGTGLGLSVARRLARLLGGDLTLESIPDTGTRFTVTLPLRTPVTESAPPVWDEGRVLDREARRAS